MKVKYRPSPQLEFELEGVTQKDIFRALSDVSELFSEKSCGHCQSENIYFRVRSVTAQSGKNKGKCFDYYEIVCHACGYSLSYGQHQQGGTLFPKRMIEVDGQDTFDKQNLGWKPPMKKEELNGEEGVKPEPAGKETVKF